jgi:hypothetical protein
VAAASYCGDKTKNINFHKNVAILDKNFTPPAFGGSQTKALRKDVTAVTSKKLVNKITSPTTI